MIGINILLSVIWLAAGMLIGTLSFIARLDFAARGLLRGVGSVWSTLGLGAVTALAGGWLGALLFGRLYGTPMAIWISIVAVALLPWALKRLQRQRQ